MVDPCLLREAGACRGLVTGQHEVCAYGDDGEGDDNDNWIVQSTGGKLGYGHKFELVHESTGFKLHSHGDESSGGGHSHPLWTMNQQEVTSYDDNDNDNDNDNNLWEAQRAKD